MTKDINVVVDNGHIDESLLDAMFDGEDFIIVSADRDMFGILAEAGLFPSRSQAMKNWKRTGPEVPDGFTHIEGIGKKRNSIAIWKPKE